MSSLSIVHCPPNSPDEGFEVLFTILPSVGIPPIELFEFLIFWTIIVRMFLYGKAFEDYDPAISESRAQPCSRVTSGFPPARE